MTTTSRHTRVCHWCVASVATGQKYRTDKSMTHQPLKGVCHGTVGRGGVSERENENWKVLELKV